ncbi:hypothetical protein [Streptomyces sp. NBC_01237]|uniref:hypothetical protein n=1 Tax=Streptomyces sp. NBC_01237 TaxID=2903790 RepID=UPI003FA3A416
MSRTSRTRHHNRTLAVAAGLAVGAVLFAAGPASAHVEVESEKAQALAENVTLAFEAESESGTAGITELRVVLPEGIAPADVVYGEGPVDTACRICGAGRGRPGGRGRSR